MGMPEAKTGMPMLLDFSQEGCGACDYLDYNVFGDQQVASAIADRFVPLRVDVTPGIATAQHTDLAGRYRIIGTPTLIIADSEGQTISRVDKVLDQPLMLKWLASIKANAPARPAVQ